MEIGATAGKCVRCGRSEEQVKLFDGIYINESVKICEKCSLLANVPIIKRPSAEQLKDSEKPYGVRKRLMILAGLTKDEKIEKSASEQLMELEKRPELEKPEDMKFKLADNFHWVIQTNRRRKGLSAKQLADSIAESESAIKMLENKSIPRDSYDIIRKIEQFLNVKLIKEDNFDKVMKNEKMVPRAESVILPFEETPPSKSEETIIAPEKPKEISASSFKRESASKFRIEDLRRANNKITAQVNKGNVPTIYDLMKKKEEDERINLVGKNIELVEDEKNEKISNEKWNELE